MNTSNATYSVIVTGEPCLGFKDRWRWARRPALPLLFTLVLVVAKPNSYGRTNHEAASLKSTMIETMRPPKFTEKLEV